MVKIVLLAFICVSSLSSIVNASSGFYISASSLRSQENASTTTSVTASNVTYNSNMAGLKLVPDDVNVKAYKFTNATISFDTADMSPIHDIYINKQITLRLGSSFDNITTTGPNVTDNGRWTADCNWGVCQKYTISEMKYTDQQETVKLMVANEVNAVNKPITTPNFTINNSGGFEFSTGYKFQQEGGEGGNFFFSPQIDYSSFGSNSTPLRISGLSAIAKVGVSFSKASIYGFGGFSSISSNSSSGSTQEIIGNKYGIGTEFSLTKNIALFAEAFQIDLQNNLSYSSTPSSSSQLYSPSTLNASKPSTAIKEYIADNSNTRDVVITNTVYVPPLPGFNTYKLTMHHLQLSHYIDQKSIQYTTTTTTTTNITSIAGFKVGVTMYFNNSGNEESYY